MKNHENELFRARQTIDALTVENADLKIKLAILTRDLPTDNAKRKEQFFREALERGEVIHIKKNKKESSCKGA